MMPLQGLQTRESSQQLTPTGSRRKQFAHLVWGVSYCQTQGVRHYLIASVHRNSVSVLDEHEKAITFQQDARALKIADEFNHLIDLCIRTPRINGV